MNISCGEFLAVLSEEDPKPDQERGRKLPQKLLQDFQVLQALFSPILLHLVLETFSMLDHEAILQKQRVISIQSL